MHVYLVRQLQEASNLSTFSPHLGSALTRLGHRLDRLRRKRIKADYKLNENVSTSQPPQVLGELEQLKEELREVDQLL